MAPTSISSEVVGGREWQPVPDASPAAFCPRVVVSKEPDWHPSNADGFLAQARVRYRTGAADALEEPTGPVPADPLDPTHLGLDTPYTFDGHSCSDLTRPFLGKGADRGGVPRDHGFVLPIHGDSPLLTQASWADQTIPMFSEVWVTGSIAAHVFWSFNAASDLAAIHPLWSILDRGLPAEPSADIRTELGVPVPDAHAAASRAVHLAENVRYVHQGDWEGITVVTWNEIPMWVFYRAHHDADPIPYAHACVAGARWGDVVGDQPTPIVLSAPLSHASYPPDANPQIDRLPQPSSAAVAQVDLLPAFAAPWYGYAGAWGSSRLPASWDHDVGVNPADELTGPLGPSIVRITRELSTVSMVLAKLGVLR